MDDAAIVTVKGNKWVISEEGKDDLHFEGFGVGGIEDGVYELYDLNRIKKGKYKDNYAITVIPRITRNTCQT